MDSAEDNEELQFFRERWKAELRRDVLDGSSNFEVEGGNLKLELWNKNFPGVVHCFGGKVRQLGNRLRTVECLRSSDESPPTPEDKSTGPIAKENNEIVLLNLPEPKDVSGCDLQQRVQTKLPTCIKESRKSLLDQLIEDIDEITSIPFFDLNLPKEVGIQIFNHLGVRELCVCAQVSKSWKVLAEDELIWFHVGCKLGYVQERDCAAIDRVNWKGFIRDSILEERELRRNWKERICGLSSLEFERGDVYAWHTSLSASPLCHCRCEGSVKSVSLATNGPPAFAAISDHELKIQMSDPNGQWMCLESRNYDDKVGHAMFIPHSGTYSSTDHVAIATQDTVLVLKPGKGSMSTLDHVIGGKLSCMDCTADRLALGVGSYGYGTLGNKVRLYCLETTKMVSVLGAHYREITCLDLANCPPHCLVTGSYDCRVRVFDLRSEKMTLSFHLGYKRAVTAVQMDDWKVVSGAEDGTLVVWDQRMTTSALWITHARHPVRLCKFQGSRMITANIPIDKALRANLWYADDLILHRRHRGVIRMFDFSVNNATEGIPKICSSNYDNTTGYNYNIKLSVPYDNIET